MVIVVKAFVVKLGITQYGSCYASITMIVNLYKEKERERNGKDTEPKSKLDLPQDRISVFCPASTVATVSRGTQASLERESRGKKRHLGPTY